MVFIIPTLEPSSAASIVTEYACKTLLHSDALSGTLVSRVLVLDASSPHWHIQHVRCFYRVKHLPALLVLDKEGNTVLEACGESDILQIESLRAIQEEYNNLRLSQNTQLEEKADSYQEAWKWVNSQGFNLLCFDVDGTITTSNINTTLAVGVTEFISNIRPGTRVALVTNQGGVGLRYWMESGHFGKPGNLPDEAKTRLSKIRDQLLEINPSLAIRIFVAYRYQSKADPSSGKSANWGPCPVESARDERWSKEWRKPNPGMLQAAMQWAGASRLGTLMVGDMQSDKDAAEGAGVIFRWAPEFFIKGIELPQIADVGTIVDEKFSSASL
ncbi:hypothetical protein Pmar_PMAR003193 [Perkinsus marinus ATCC 50983]|uniref:D,D-heptose 1,7-bisphosphate phosphatase n=1 Tax=Perkinsus marinus (strain ATCC 50983 / TXsc) TaxID=423536 RepID=C5L6Q3_PERM5|nr:hypothetical protein Pmar_PMAR003193 [Perkinsus marinus ATCC 50983]EER07589.1 hypothetical protein Pmar_PMAR003193 [Perkinsus marinus ATCC 50983]|eukprot:XP_002775773.1 hypothetical protein Pmar_PMAR003193 [Perkinsus marinus ATCC 50983]